MSQNKTGHSKKYFHIGFHFAELILARELEPIFYKYTEDWVRYTRNCWIVYTKYNPEELLNKLKPYLSDKDEVLILEIATGQDLKGWLPQWIWDWLYKPRN